MDINYFCKLSKEIGKVLANNIWFFFFIYGFGLFGFSTTVNYNTITLNRKF